jgi:predicted ArsR family transcriptional regulator
MVFRNPSPSLRGSLASDIASLSTLDDPGRAAIFFYVVSSGADVTREQTAEALGITRRAAAFHLDKLAEAGLVAVTFRRLTGRTGPGAGRSSKLYHRSGRRLNVSIPVRNYELMARLLASVVQQPDGQSAAPALKPRARAFGLSIGAAARKQTSPHPSRKRLLEVLVDALTGHGFEPFADRMGTLRLRNCPYHDMAREDADFVCSMNLALMQGVVEGLELADLSPALEPREGMCCVGFHGVQHPPYARRERPTAE